MNPALYMIIFLPLLIAIMNSRKALRFIRAKQIRNRKFRKGTIDMGELAKHFIGVDCILYYVNGGTISGVVKAVSENAVLLRRKSKLEIVNLDFIGRIAEYPKKANGKRKLVV